MPYHFCATTHSIHCTEFGQFVSLKHPTNYLIVLQSQTQQQACWDKSYPF